MADPKTLKAILLSMTASLVLAACSGGASEVASPGEGAFGGDGGAGSGSGGGGGGGSGAAADCPNGFANVGTVSTPSGSLRNCQFPSLISGNLVVPLRTGTIYSLSGRVDVGEDRGGDVNAPISGADQGILTIEPGVRIFGSAGLDYIVVNRGSQIFAEGSSTQPIVFTSRQSVEGTTGENSIGQWGGLIVLGRANISNCAMSDYGTANCEANVEGTVAQYGGNNNADNSGTLKYVRIQHSGFQLQPNNEINGITFAGVGSGTTVDFVQVHNSSDDGIEFFGGTVNARHIVLTGNDDDSLDTDQGYAGSIQYVITVQRPAGGDKLVESSMASLASGNPRSNPKISNFTFIARGANAGLVMNTGTDNVFYNGTVANGGGAGACLDIDNQPSTTGTFRSVYLTCPTAFDADGDDEASIFNHASNTANGASTLANIFVNGTNETAVTPTSPTGLSGFFQAVTYIGAVRDGSDNWWDSWTCSGLIGRPAC